MGTCGAQETSSPTESDRPLGARFMGGAGLEVFSGVSVATAPKHLRVLLMNSSSLEGELTDGVQRRTLQGHCQRN